MERTYIVNTKTYGEIRKVDDNIEAARAWAKRAFDGDEVLSVHRESHTPLCPWCDSRPCECRKSR
jgi:hypothetical protein